MHQSIGKDGLYIEFVSVYVHMQIRAWISWAELNSSNRSEKPVMALQMLLDFCSRDKSQAWWELMPNKLRTSQFSQFWSSLSYCARWEKALKNSMLVSSHLPNAPNSHEHNSPACLHCRFALTSKCSSVTDVHCKLCQMCHMRFNVIHWPVMI